MSSKLKIILAVIITAALTFFLTKEFSAGFEVIDKKTDTTTTVTTSIKETKNTFTAEQVGNIKKILIDSLGAVYGERIKSLLTSPQPSPYKGEGEEDSLRGYAFVSKVDSNFAAKDSAGNVTDSIQVISTFISPEPLPENSIHLLNINHKSFTKTIEKETTITNTDVVQKKKSFIENFQLSPSIGAGYGFIHKQFDVYAGVGLRYEFDFISIF